MRVRRVVVVAPIVRKRPATEEECRELNGTVDLTSSKESGADHSRTAELVGESVGGEEKEVDDIIPPKKRKLEPDPFNSLSNDTVDHIFSYLTDRKDKKNLLRAFPALLCRVMQTPESSIHCVIDLYFRALFAHFRKEGYRV